MKKFLCIVIALCCGIQINNFSKSSNVEVAKAVSNVTPIEKHLLLNDDGSYGGSYNESLYGKGAPKNGEFDLPNSPYFIAQDFYNMPSTNEDYPLTLLPNFKPYQQTMANSSAFASLVMVFNYFGLDVKNAYSEILLYQKYQEFLQSKQITTTDVDSGFLTDFINYLQIEGVSARYQPITTGGKKQNAQKLSDSIERNLKEGKIIMLRYHSQVDFGWKVVIGIDRMGTEKYYDDVVILANPYDVADHYQDGYSVQRVGSLCTWLLDVNENFETTFFDETMLIDFGVVPNFNRQARDKTSKQQKYATHFILNAEGSSFSYGGTRNKELYGSVSTGDGMYDCDYTKYYKINDYYNMDDEGSRLILKNYKTFQQTMASSCGIASTMSVLSYLGEDITEYDEVVLCERYESINNTPILNNGTSGRGLSKVVEERGFASRYDSTVKGEDELFPTYESYRDFVKENLKKDQPIAISARPQGGHWIVIIGIDDMGTDNVYDDVIITADPNDYWDHYQDGYNTWSAMHLYRSHYGISGTTFIHKNSYLIIERKQDKGLPVWALITIISGGVLVLGGAGALTFYLIKKKRKSIKN